MSPHDVMSGANVTTHKNAVICLSIFIMSIIFFFTIRCAQPHWSHLRFVSFFLGAVTTMILESVVDRPSLYLILTKYSADSPGESK